MTKKKPDNKNKQTITKQTIKQAEAKQTKNLTYKKADAWMHKFLQALAESPNVTGAAHKAGVNRTYVYEVRKASVEFAAAWDDAMAQAMDKAEGEIYRRAVEGWDKPVYQQGAEVGKVREYSDTLLIFLAKAHRPERYRENNQITNLQIDVTKLSTEQLQRIADGEDPAKVIADSGTG